MGTLTESFSSLSELLLSESQRAPAARGGSAVAVRSQGDLLISRLLKPLMPAALRCGTGTILDIKDRQVGPFDVIGCAEAYPPMGEGAASVFLSDGVLFCLQARNWAVEDLTTFGEMAAALKKLDRKADPAIFCGAVAFDMIPMDQINDFLRSASGEAVDGILSVGNHLILRNQQGWYGDPRKIPFVTERGGPESLKAFAFFLLHLCQSSLHIPFGLADYQHL